MKKDKSLKPKEETAPPAATQAEAEKAPAPVDLGLIERRRSIRPLPVPEVVESDGDSVWGTFQSLISEETKK